MDDLLSFAAIKLKWFHKNFVKGLVFFLTDFSKIQKGIRSVLYLANFKFCVLDIVSRLISLKTSELSALDFPIAFVNSYIFYFIHKKTCIFQGNCHLIKTLSSNFFVWSYFTSNGARKLYQMEIPHACVEKLH